MTKDARMNALKNAGIDVNNMFSFKFEDCLKPGARIDVFVTNGDEIEAKIRDDGYVDNPHLYRRWVCAQMLRIVFRIKEDPWRYGKNFAEYMRKNYSWDYQLKMMENELKVLVKMERDHDPQFEIRSKFFSIENVKKIYGEFREDYLKIMSAPRNFHNWKEERLKMNFVLINYKCHWLNECDNYCSIIEYVTILNNVFRSLKQIGESLDFSKTWLDCYKGAGAYYTLQNLVLFHNVAITAYFGEYKITMDGKDAYNYLNQKVDEYRNEGWRMFGFMKKVLKDNRFDITKLY